MDFEKYFSSSGIKGNIQQAIAAETADTLKNFCRQEAEFAQAVQQSGKSFQNCLDYVAKGAGSSLSDFKAYSKAVEFYFPGAKIQFQMKIDLIGDAVKHVPEQNTPQQKKITVSFNSSSFMDF